MKLEDKVLEIVSPLAKSAGFEIEYIEFVKEANDNILRVVIDKEGSSISIDDCENISKMIENDIDKIIDKEYVLEVSSPGLERQLKNLRLYKKYIGESVHIKLYKKSDIGKEFDGILTSVDEANKTVNIKLQEKEIILELDKISSAHTNYDFTQDLKDGKKENVNINKLNKF